MNGTSQEIIVKYEAVLETERQFIVSLIEANQADDLERVMALMTHVKYERWPSTKKTDEEYETVNG